MRQPRWPRLRAPVTAIRSARHGFIVEIGGEAPMLIGCHTLVNAAGHGAPALARAIAVVKKGGPALVDVVTQAR